MYVCIYNVVNQNDDKDYAKEIQRHAAAVRLYNVVVVAVYVYESFALLVGIVHARMHASNAVNVPYVGVALLTLLM